MKLHDTPLVGADRSSETSLAISLRNEGPFPGHHPPSKPQDIKIVAFRGLGYLRLLRRNVTFFCFLKLPG